MKKLFVVLFTLVMLFPALVFADAYGEGDQAKTKWYQFDWVATAPKDGVTGYGLPGWTAAEVTDFEGGTTGYCTNRSTIPIEGKIYRVEFSAISADTPYGEAATYVAVLSAVTPIPVTVGVTPYPISGAIPVAYGASGTTVLVFNSTSINADTRPGTGGASTWATAPVESTDYISLTIFGAYVPGTGNSPYAVSGSAKVYYVESDFSGEVGRTPMKVYQFNYATDHDGEYEAYSEIAINGWIHHVIEKPEATGSATRKMYLYNNFDIDILEGDGDPMGNTTAAWRVPTPTSDAFIIPRFNDGRLRLKIEGADSGVSPVQKQGQVRIYYTNN